MAPERQESPGHKGGIDGQEGRPRQPGELVQMYSSHSRLEKGRVVTLAYGISGLPKLLTYDLRKLVRVGGVLTCLCPGTILRVDDGVLRHMLGLLLTSVTVAITMWGAIENLKDMDTSSLEKLAEYMNGFCPFVLGLYVSLALARWWALRTQALGAVFDAVANTAMIVSCVLPNKEYAAVRDLVVKWGMASIFLLVKAARDDSNVQDLAAKGVLSQKEVDNLQGVSQDGRAMVMWGWIMRICQETFESARGPRPHAPKLMAIFNQCIAARNGIQTIHTYLKTQLPFAYVHLLTLLVNVNNLVVAIKCGAVFVVANANNDHQSMVYQFLMLFLVPVLYHGLLSISYVIQDPFGEDMLDFPIAAFIEYVAQCADAALVAQEVYPGQDLSIEQVNQAAAATPQQNKKDLEVGEVDADAVGQQSAMMAAVESIREFNGAVSSELHIIATQLKQLHESVAGAESRRKNDAERLCEVLLEKKAGGSSSSSTRASANQKIGTHQEALPPLADRGLPANGGESLRWCGNPSMDESRKQR